MHLTVREENTITVITFSETRLEARITDEFVSEVTRLVHEGKKRIVLNITDVEFIDSCYLGALLGISTTCKQAGGTIVISNAQEYIKKLFRIVRIDHVFQIFDTQDEAMHELLAMQGGKA